MSGTLLAGSGRVDITPTTPQFLDGYANRTERSEGAYQPIFARALYVAGGGGEAVLVSAEVLAFDTAQVARPAARDQSGLAASPSAESFYSRPTPTARRASAARW